MTELAGQTSSIGAGRYVHRGLGSLRLLLFVLFFVLVLLLALPFPFGVFGLDAPVSAWWDTLWEPVVPWVATHVFHIPHAFPRWGPAETTWDYVQAAASVMIAAMAALACVIFGRRRLDVARLDEGLRIYLRLFLAAVLFSYGWTKVFPVQFPALGPDRLSQAFGEASPNGFLWAFMGYSRGYMTFAGIGELLAGALLCFRRTASSGAMFGVGVMTNVVALNFAFDVGVKLASTFYLAGLIYLAAPDAQRLFKALVFNRPLELRETPPGTRPRAFTVVIPGILAAYLFVREGTSAWRSAHEWGQWAPHPALYGLYDVESITRNGVRDVVSPVDSTRWTQVAIGQSRSTIRLASGYLGFYVAKVDTIARSIRLTSRDDPTSVVQLDYERPDTARLLLRGHMGSDPVIVLLRRRDEKRYRLVSHPFHWVQNSAENR